MGLTTREEWLNTAVERLVPLVEKHGKVPDSIRVLCSWPSRNIRKVIGECYRPEWTDDGSIYITISPALRDPRAVLHTLLHELVHAIGQRGHGQRFQNVCHRCGLLNEGKESTTDENTRSPELNARFTEITTELGDYPHVALTPPEKKKAENQEEKKKPYTKCFSVDNPEYWVYVKTTLLEKHGPPVCPTSKKPMEIIKEEDDE